MVTIIQCQCGHPSCIYYGVSNGSFNQGNGWDKKTAEFVAWAFNNREALDTLVASGMLPEIQHD